MASYGISLESEHDFRKDAVCPLFVRYFENPELTKIKKDINNYSMYMVEIYSMLGIEKRYLIAFVREDGEMLGQKKRLSELSWDSLQTRTFPEIEYSSEQVGIHTYNPRRLPELNYKITLQYKDDAQYVYTVEKLPIQITLLPKSKHLDYSKNGTIITALETYQTLVNLK
jgi:hypothetical protein